MHVGPVPAMGLRLAVREAEVGSSERMERVCSCYCPGKSSPLGNGLPGYRFKAALNDYANWSAVLEACFLAYCVGVILVCCLKMRLNDVLLLNPTSWAMASMEKSL